MVADALLQTRRPDGDLPTADDVRAAAARLKGRVMRTPLVRAEKLSAITGADLWLKFESLQYTGAFKERGALNKLLSLTAEEKSRGVIAASAGNHAQGLARHAKAQGVPATIVMPTTTPDVKVRQTRALDAEVVLAGHSFEEAQARATAICAERGLVFATDPTSAWACTIGGNVAENAGGVFARLFAAVRPPAAQRALLRDTYRYFPHMAERTAGLARGAKVAPVALAALSARAELAAPDVLRIVTGARGACVARALPPDALVVLRASAPDTDYRSLELVALERIAPFVGVNEHGLAVGAVLLGSGGEECAAPAVLLAQDCLQRFDRVEKALEWLERRPAGGRAAFALADATGAAATFEIDAGARKRGDPIETPVSPRTAEGCCIAVADPTACALAWTFADGSTGEAGFGA